MHQKLLELLRYFSESDLNRLDKFMFSPFFNESERLTALYNYIRQFAPDFLFPENMAKTVFAHLFPGRDFDQALLNKLNSQLFKLVETFLAHHQLEEDRFAKDLHLLQFYNQVMLPKHITSTLSSLEKLLNQSSYRNLDYFRKVLAINNIRAEYMAQTDKRTGDINLQELNDALDIYFMLAKLMFLNSMLTRRKIAKIDYDFTWMQETLDYLEDSDYIEIPAIDIYREILLLQLHPTEQKYYTRLKDLLNKHNNLFPDHELRDFFIYLENAVKHIFPVESYFQELFDLYNMQLNACILHENGYLPHTVFKNVASAALTLQKFDWAKEFIENNWQKVIPKEFRLDAYYQNLASLHFFTGDYDKAQELLLESNPVDIYYKLSQKILLAEIYFEKRELEVLENFLNTFTKFIFDQQAKIAPEKVASYRQFVNFFKKMLRILTDNAQSLEAFENRAIQINPVTIKALKKLSKQISRTPLFYSKKWLLSKIQEQL